MWAIFVTSVLCLVVLYVLWLAFLALVPEPVPIRDSMSLKWYLDERCHTGDLVFFRSRVDWLHRLVSPMTHVALVVMHPVSGEPWVVEMHDDRAVEGEGAGVHCYPARQRLGEFGGELYVLPIAKPRNAAQVLGLAGTLADVRYTPHVRMHVAKCKLMPWECSPSKGMMCSEFVAFILAKTGVLRTGWTCVTPSDLLGRAACSGAYQVPFELK